MKSTYLTAAAAVLVAGSAFAGVSTTNKIGRIKVDSGMANTIIALPFTTIGELDSTQMNATNYVLTTNLKTGDTLTEMSVEGSSYIWSGWTLLDDGGPWTAVTQSEGSNTRPPSATAVFNRGRALMLKRTGYNPTTSGPFYIIGQIAMNGCSFTPVANSGSARYTPTLVANPYPHSITLQALCGYVTGTPSANDQIVLGTGETAAYDAVAASWKYVVNAAYAEWPTTDVPTIPAGVGFWYRSKGSSVPTFTFPAE